MSRLCESCWGGGDRHGFRTGFYLIRIDVYRIGILGMKKLVSVEDLNVLMGFS